MIKKSELYTKLWASCDQLRGGMDASQYKDYVLVMLFIKYVSDKYSNVQFAPISIPKGASFNDMVALKGTDNIGDDINKKIIAPLAEANKLADMPDFNDPTKLGNGKEMVDRLTNLIAIFEDPKLDFSKNRADGDDILGDAYEYLMRHFATESGKSKGQFYTPAEVSRVIAHIIGISPENSTATTTVYDPTCGSGSLLLKVTEAAGKQVSLYGQEKDSATAGLARMNMILHDNPMAEIKQGNTLANPLYKKSEHKLTTFDYVVANPPFSDKGWSNGVKISDGKDSFGRFSDYGMPPEKNGDYAYLLHIVRSLKGGKGKGACILPHGVLFRGNAEAGIREKLVQTGIVKGIIGLPANLFYGTGIPACILILDKENVKARTGIFMMDASKGFMKDGNKNRLRHRDIHQIIDVFNKQLSVSKYARLVDYEEIKQNEYNLNLSRYIDSQEEEDLQDIEAHLMGGIPNRDIEALQSYWEVFPKLKEELFVQGKREKYVDLKFGKEQVKQAIFSHPEFEAFMVQMDAPFEAWRLKTTAELKKLTEGLNPKKLIIELSESLLRHYMGKALIDPYDVYQQLMDYWDETMQDDAYLIAADGWKAETYRIIQLNKNKKEVDKGWSCDLLPKGLVANHFYAEDQQKLDCLTAQAEGLSLQISELEEENSGDDGCFSVIDKVNKTTVQARLKEIKKDRSVVEELAVLSKYLELADTEAKLKVKIKAAEKALDDKIYSHYPKLTVDEIKLLVVDNKWMMVLEKNIKCDLERISQRLTQRIRELAERYETPLPAQQSAVEDLEDKLKVHLQEMGFIW